VTKCAKCFHEKENHLLMDGTNNCVCNGSLQCRCDLFEEPYLVLFAQRIEEEKYQRKSIHKRCSYILEKIPQTRNAGEKTFAKIYKEIWHGFKIRKNYSTPFTTDKWLEMPSDDTINREKRRCKQWNEKLRTYDPEVIMEQTAIYQALMEMAIEVTA